MTLSATALAPEVLARIDTSSPGGSVKDSFACLNLVAADFEVLVDAWWIYLAADRLAPAPPRHVRWAPVRIPDALLAWETAWGDGKGPIGLFRPELLANGTVLVLGGYLGAQIIAGAVANRSASVVGISNLFAWHDDLDGGWTVGLAAVARHFPGLPIVGYEHGKALDAATRHGCTPIGPLRIWHQIR